MAQTETSKIIKKLNERLAEMERHGIQDSSQYKTLVGQLDAIAKSSGLTLKTTKSGHTALPNSKKLSEDAQKRLKKIAEGNNTWGNAKKRAEEMLNNGSKEKVQVYRSPNGNIIGTSNSYDRSNYEQLKEDGASDDDIREMLTNDGYTKKQIDEFINNDEHYLPVNNTTGYTDDEIANVLKLSADVHDVITNYAQAIYKLEDDGLISLHKDNGGNGRLSLEEMEMIMEVENLKESERLKMAQQHQANEDSKRIERGEKEYNKERQKVASMFGTDVETYEKAEDIYLNMGLDNADIFEIIDAIKNGTEKQYIIEHTEIPFV